jgi:hypothetical protein
MEKVKSQTITFQVNTQGQIVRSVYQLPYEIYFKKIKVSIDARKIT